jgi:hypothetical protein
MSATPERITWTFQGRPYRILHGHYGFERGTDHVGRPNTGVRPQVVTLTLDSADEDAALSSYMLDPYRRAGSYLEQRRADGTVLHRLHLQAAHCVGLRGHFAPGDPDGGPGETLTLRLSAAALTLDGLTLEAHSVLPWHAPEEVRRRARMLGDETNLAAARAVAPPALPLPKVQAPAAAAPPALPSNAAKGVYGEHLSDTYLRAQGHRKLNDGGLVTPPPPGGTARGTGIDGVWKHGNPPPDYLISEAKYGQSRLAMTKDGKQMGDTWIQGSGRLQKAVGSREAGRIVTAMALGTVEKRLHKVDATGKLIEQILL